MQKLNRNLVLALTLFTASATCLHAEQLGTNPKPKSSSQSVLVQTVLAVLSVFSM